MSSSWSSRPRLVVPVLAVLGVAAGCAPPHSALPYPEGEPEEGAPPVVEEALPPGVVRFFDRKIELEPFLAGFPYGDFEADVEHGRLFYLERGDAYTLRTVPLSSEGAYDLGVGQAISDVDWSQRSLWAVRLHAATDTLWLHADERNDERMNLWTLDLRSAALIQVTRSDYVYGFGFSEDETKIAYLPRTGTQAPYRTCLHLLDVETREDRELLCDEPSLTFTWGTPRFSPDGKEVIFNANVDGDRNRGQLVRVDLEAGAPRAEPITDPARPRSAPSIIEGWVGDELFYLSNEDGYRNVFAYRRRPGRKGKTRQVTAFREDVSGAAVTDVGVFVVHGTPAGSTVEVLASDSRDRPRASLPGQVSVLGAHGRSVLWSQQAPDTVFEMVETRLESTTDGGVAMRNRKVVELDPELAAKIVRCEAKAARIPTFDVDPATGQARELHAFVLSPKDPPTDAHRLVAIRAFYGGENVYTTYDHVLCAAGVTVVSPAVRGSSGFGREFYALNDRDLGGDEIIDLFHVARWVEREMGIGSERIGVYGRSHGGYATMRALTFPPARPRGADPAAPLEHYEFGFGLAEAGFSDIVAFHAATNIPDWVVLEAGDPAVPEDLTRLRDRSPLTHAASLEAPLFLLHGANDWRVPVEGSRAFAAAASAAGGPVTYVEVEGQGHSIKGLSRNVEAWQARLDFLMSLPVLAGQASGEDRSGDAASPSSE